MSSWILLLSIKYHKYGNIGPSGPKVLPHIVQRGHKVKSHNKNLTHI